MTKAILIGISSACFVILFWVGMYFLFKVTGGENQASGMYGFTSGPGPMILTAIGMGSIVGSLWHNLNCHKPGCWNMGKHKVNGTPWCNVHHEEARHEKTQEQLLSEILEVLRADRG